MEKVLGVVGSPRKKGNTHILVSRILEGAEAEGAATDVIFLGKLKIRECDGCHACWKGKPCAKRDDMNDLYPKIIESDAIVLGTPVYWYGPTALMKGFIDRFVYFNCPENRAKIKGKLAAIAVPYEEENPETAQPVVAFFEKSLAYLEINLIGKVIVPGVSDRGDVLQKKEALAKAYKLGQRLAGV
ncbi:MAG: flavodoxin family protein [Anaerolineae bacterium]|nr:flavodoxin family protein [Anaerolineae bacterium]